MIDTSGGLGAPAPLISIVMPVYRRPQHVHQSLRTLLCQTERDFELLVRDDGDGRDRTEAAVRAAAAGDSRVRYFRNPARLGMPGNLNEGIREARGAFIAVCHDHDLYSPRFLSCMLDLLRRYPTALFAHCGTQVLAEDGTVEREAVSEWPEVTEGREWLQFMLRSLSCPVCALTLVRREAHQRYGLYESRFGFVADVELWMRLSLHGDVAYAAAPLVALRPREADHALRYDPGAVRLVARIHRQYLGETLRGLAYHRARGRLTLRVARAFALHYAWLLSRPLVAHARRPDR